MGGHGGLNILPQKRWNVYNFDNREKVRKDEEAAAKEEQVKREQSRKRDTEVRLEQLRQARGLASESTSVEAEPESKHINLFQGIRIFDPVGDEKRKGFKRMKKEEEAPKVVLPEDDKYRLGYGVAGKGVKSPWYLEKRPNQGVDHDDSEMVSKSKSSSSSSSRKKSLEELREERLKREAREKERERALMGRPQNQRGSLTRR